MKKIPTPKGLENYYPMGISRANLSYHLPNRKIAIAGRRVSDGEVFYADEWVELNDGKQVRLLGFTGYDYPIYGREETSRYIVQGIWSSVNGLCFHDLDEWEWKGELNQR